MTGRVRFIVRLAWRRRPRWVGWALVSISVLLATWALLELAGPTVAAWALASAALMILAAGVSIVFARALAAEAGERSALEALERVRIEAARARRRALELEARELLSHQAESSEHASNGKR